MEIFESVSAQRSPMNIPNVDKDILKGVARGKKISNRGNNMKVNNSLHGVLIVFASFLRIVLGNEECEGGKFRDKSVKFEHRYSTAELGSPYSPALEQLDQIIMKGKCEDSPSFSTRYKAHENKTSRTARK